MKTTHRTKMVGMTPYMAGPGADTIHRDKDDPKVNEDEGGNDTIYGRLGIDTIHGGPGTDTIERGENDIIHDDDSNGGE